MRLKISGYDKDNKLLFSNADFDGEIFYEKMIARISDNLGFTWMSNHLEEPQKKRVLLDRRISDDLRFVLKIASKDKALIQGAACVKDAIRFFSGLDYGNLTLINDYFTNIRNILRETEKLVFEKINM